MSDWNHNALKNHVHDQIDVRIHADPDPKHPGMFTATVWDVTSGKPLLNKSLSIKTDLKAFLTWVVTELAPRTNWRLTGDLFQQPQGASGPPPLGGPTPGPGDPNPKDVLNLPSQIIVNTPFSFSIYEYNQYNLSPITSLCYHLQTTDANGGFLTTLQAPGSSSGFSVYGDEAKTQVLTGGQYYYQMYLFPIPPGQPTSLAYGSSVSIPMVAKAPVGTTAMQIRFSVLSDQYHMEPMGHTCWPEQFGVSPVLTVSS